MKTFPINRKLTILISILGIPLVHGAKTKIKRGCSPSTSSAIDNPIGGHALVANPPTFSSASVPVAISTKIGPVRSDSISRTDSATSYPASSTASSAVNSSSQSHSSTMLNGEASVTASNLPSSSSGTASNNSITNSRVSGKAGIGWPVQEVDVAPIKQFFSADSAVSWWFNWNKNWNSPLVNSDGVKINAEFIPMIFGAEYLDNSVSFQDGINEMMGYNEPDLKGNGGVASYLEPSAAAEKWKTQIIQIRQQYSGIKVHSPVVASNKTWLVEFFKSICPDDSASNEWGDCQYKPDYLSLHLYNTDITYFRNTLSDTHRDFGLPVVLSEFACFQFSENRPTPSLEQVSKFMEEAMTWLDQQDWVVKYAWFGAARAAENLHDVYETNRLMDESGAITELGRQYMNGGKKI
ncbi:uncharacterized protein L201_000827 [Kwoniella dendrophila CBS 6074]|uniref:Asl1-like glycosyl hydrolase catalytic domain-containing protein n=1 Tax=Kwoniella dendrophila CBS 6074 TaxID=1295534 RepID=A0AAX4JKM4_9TREE